MSDASSIKTSAQVRDEILNAFRMDVVGPDTRPAYHDDHMSNFEVITSTHPSSFYLIGYLTPAEGSTAALPRNDAPEIQHPLPSMEDDDEHGAAGGEDSDGGNETKQRKRLDPTSLGLTAFVAPDCPYIDVALRYADYHADPPIPEAVLEGISKDAPKDISWHRKPRFVERRIDASILAEALDAKEGLPIPLLDTETSQRKGGCLHLHVMVQKVDLLRPEGSIDGLSVTIFVVNRRPESQRFRDVSNVFQVGLELKTGGEGFIGNPDMSGYDADDPDLRLYDLHYQDVLRFAGGRNVGTAHAAPTDGLAPSVWTDHLPSADVEKVDQNESLIDVAEFNMLKLAKLAEDPAQLAASLSGFPENYAEFISSQGHAASTITSHSRREVAQELVEKQREAWSRMRNGIELLKTDAAAIEAFRAMNLSINSYLEKRGVMNAKWRPFQLAFILLNLDGLSDPTHDDRKTVDLLFFPTGGGKTEAYLGIAAYQIAYRRLTHADWLGSGVCVIMRYTLRLLTLDQLGRAAAMICALELLRRSPEWQQNGQPKLGLAPIEIGLWVGAAATPNKIGGRGEQDSAGRHAYTKVNRHRKLDREAPAPIKQCPWCGTNFDRDTFHIAGKRMLINCANIDCDFSGEAGGLPVLAVDEEIFNRLPAFIIGTVDKFAALPRRGEVGRFFDNVDRFDEGSEPKHMRFYGADEPGVGNLLSDEAQCLPPPSLIIQDELHLISGPLGTIAGLYEAMVDRLASRTINGELRGPKIIASSATVRRAEDQIQELFGRTKTAIFPPPGIDRKDSHFALTRSLEDADGRRYVGISALGIGPRKVMLRSVVPILASCQRQFEQDNRDGPENPADPYMTALCYFNALRELGASRRIIEDEVATNLRVWPSRRLRDGQLEAGSSFASRNIAAPNELTSRLSTDDVAIAKERLEHSFTKTPKPKGQTLPLDVALATNMISVGLDITRLGLMIVQNQPKSAAEYIQATSRVGRDTERPGIVLVILNMHRARDRAHYEDFETYHKAFYRAVEATSVTPGSMRAKDRALGAVFAGLVRHLNPDFTVVGGASRFDPDHPVVVEASNFLIDRFCTQEDIKRLKDGWIQILNDRGGGDINWDTHRADDQGLMHNPLTDLSALAKDFALFEASWSMRDVQPGISLEVKDYLAGPIISGGTTN